MSKQFKKVKLGENVIQTIDISSNFSTGKTLASLSVDGEFKGDIKLGEVNLSDITFEKNFTFSGDYTLGVKKTTKDSTYTIFSGTNLYNALSSLFTGKLNRYFYVKYANGTIEYKSNGTVSVMTSDDCVLTSDGAIVYQSEVCKYVDTEDQVMSEESSLIEFNSDSLLSTGTYSFYNCQNLSSISLSNANTLRCATFANCSNLIQVYLPNVSVLTGGGVFDACSNIKEIHLPNVRYIYNGSNFHNCTNLSTFDAPNLLYLGKVSFYDCPNLLSIDLRNVVKCGFGALRNSPNLTSIRCDSLISSDYTNLWEIEKRDSRIFSGCIKLSSIDLPSKVEIGSNEFGQHSGDGGSIIPGCTELRVVRCPNADFVGYHAFYKCSNLSVVDFSERTSLTIPTLLADAFEDTNNTYEIRVPAHLYGQWIKADKWSEISNHIVAV